ncbi:MAG TPA: hypothetical protein VHD76_23500 [Bryobacteraceae bacterium]|jgi:hypothetical protein|nr:hypothetical protein [Bryobacteraceae bacterium]
MKQLRGRSLGTRLSESEYAHCEKAAARRGQTLSEWCRQVLLEAAAGPAPAPEMVATLAEILALRKIIVNLLYGERTELASPVAVSDAFSSSSHVGL